MRLAGVAAPGLSPPLRLLALRLAESLRDSISIAEWLVRPAACCRALRRTSLKMCGGVVSLARAFRWSFGSYLWKWVGHYSGAFFYGDDFIDWDICQLLDEAAGPS